MRDLLSLVLDSILSSRLFKSNSNSDSSSKRVLISSSIKELIDLNILTEYN
jgi:hypothetical protein